MFADEQSAWVGSALTAWGAVLLPINPGTLVGTCRVLFSCYCFVSAMIYHATNAGPWSWYGLPQSLNDNLSTLRVLPSALLRCEQHQLLSLEVREFWEIKKSLPVPLEIEIVFIILVIMLIMRTFRPLCSKNTFSQLNAIRNKSTSRRILNQSHEESLPGTCLLILMYVIFQELSFTKFSSLHHQIVTDSLEFMCGEWQNMVLLENHSC